MAGSSGAQSQFWVWLRAKGIRASPKLPAPPVLPALSPSKSLRDSFDRAMGQPQAREVPRSEGVPLLPPHQDLGVPGSQGCKQPTYPVPCNTHGAGEFPQLRLGAPEESPHCVPIGQQAQTKGGFTPAPTMGRPPPTSCRFPGAREAPGRPSWHWPGVGPSLGQATGRCWLQQ